MVSTAVMTLPAGELSDDAVAARDGLGGQPSGVLKSSQLGADGDVMLERPGCRTRTLMVRAQVQPCSIFKNDIPF